MSKIRKAGKAVKPPPKPERPTPDDVTVDLREQLVNAGECGPVHQVSLPTDMITSLRGLMLDLDPKWLRQKLFAGEKGSPGFRLYKHLVEGWLKNDPLFAKAEMRHTGSGLHLLFWFDEPVEIESTGDRQRWDGVIRAVQRALPTDPTAPGITALTRPVGSVNGKSGKAVKVLREGTPVTAAEVLGFFDRLRSKPFLTVATLLFGTDRVTPCPVCRGAGSVLAANDRAGQCYGGCGTVKLADLFGTVMVPSTRTED